MDDQRSTHFDQMGEKTKKKRKSRKENKESESSYESQQADTHIEDILRLAVTSKVSDVHFTIGVPPIFRKNGELRLLDEEGILTNDQTLSYARALCTKERWDTYQTMGEVDLAYEITAVSRYRVNIFKQKGNTSIAIRLIPTAIPKMDSLFLPEVLKEMIQKHQGLFLVTGPTGSGKSTTLASMIDHLNRTQKKHVITLEDPIEYVHNHASSIIDQREVGVDTQSFANGLRAALRQDPDIILVGEMRDFETISIALTAAETGHLVLGTLHTSSAASTIERLVDVFSPEQQSQIRTQLAGALVGILAQRLLPNQNHSGRVVATEMLVNTKSIANLIRSDKTHQIANMLQMGRDLGMHTMESSLTQLIQNHGVDISVAEAMMEGAD